MPTNTIRELLEIANEQSPTKIALVENEKSYSYQELFTKVNQLANYFNQLELVEGSRVGIYSNKDSEQVIAILALLSTPYIIVPITRFLKPEQVEYIVKDAGIECIITDKTKIKNIKEINFQGQIITFEPIYDEMVSFKEIYKCFNTKYNSKIDPTSSAVITYGFGSDGSQKGIVMSHKNLSDGARIVSNYLELTSDDVVSGLLSFNLDYGLNQIFCTLQSQATLALHKFILPSDFFAHLLRDKVTVLALMPVHIGKMFDEDPHRLPMSSQLDHVRVITSSGGNITTKMVKKVDDYFKPAKFYSMHGLTEALRSTYLDPSQIHNRPTSIGKAIPEVEVYIINEKGEACQANEVGELIHRGCCIYQGYWNSKEETQKRFKNIAILEKVISIEDPSEMVIATGDYVYQDEEGYIYFVDRQDDMIKTSGYRVSPKEIEEVVYNNFPTVSKCTVFGIPNDEIEEEIVLVYAANTKIPQNELVFELKKHLATYMVPTVIEYRETLPLKASHHEVVDKGLLKKEFF
ncbi:AMP-binding protein [bacterium]|nr:AMP-binding protein [bacterium]MBU1957909.1 AMP-binding protein [bacterium]